MLALISVLFVFSYSNSAQGELNAMEEHLLGKNLLIITEDPESSTLAFANSLIRGVLITEFDFIEDCPLVEEYVLRYDISPHVITALCHKYCFLMHKKWVCYIKGMITLILVQENNNCKQ
mgnify:CR=1 FL=1